MKETNWGNTMRFMWIMAIVLALLLMALAIIDQIVAHKGFHLRPILVLPLITIVLAMVIKSPTQKSN